MEKYQIKFIVENKELISILDSRDLFTMDTIPIEEIPLLYQPFDDITGGIVEHRIIKNIKQDKIFAVKDGDDSGKSSSIHYAFSELKESHFPIIFDIYLAEEIHFQSIKEFSSLLINKLDLTMKHLSNNKHKTTEGIRRLLSRESFRIEGNKKNTRIGGSGGLYMPFLGEIGISGYREIEKFVQTVLYEKTYNSERFDAIHELCVLLERHNVTPVFFLENTDKFFNRKHFDGLGISPYFFEDILMGLKGLGRPIVLTINDNYSTFPAYEYAEENILSSIVKMPRLSKQACLSIINKRIHAASTDADIHDIFEEGAIDKILNVYEESYKIKDLMFRCYECVELANIKSKEKITEDMVDEVLSR